VEAGSPLEHYLTSKENKIQGQVQQDRARLTDFPYRWRELTKATRVKCPQCGKIQPWCESVDAGGAENKAFLLGAALCFLGWAPFMAGIELSGELTLAAGLLAPVLGIVAGILIYRKLRRKHLDRLAALPWNADDLPRFDEDFLARTKAQFETYRKMSMMY